MDQQQIVDFWKFLGHEKETELRAINLTREIRNHHFVREEELIELCKKYNGSFNLYLGVNERTIGGTDKKDVTKVRIIPIDIDCVKKPASDEDIMEANFIATQIIIDAEKQGFKKPFICF